MPPRKKKSLKKRFAAQLKRFRAWLMPKVKRVLIIAVLAFLIVAGWFFLSLPSLDKLYEATKAPSVVVKAADGRIIGSYGDTYGEFLTYRQFPKSLIEAVVATEDRNFFHHLGVDPMGLARAVFVNMRAHGVVQGGSTITQQVAKNIFLTPERTFGRKLREVALAFELEYRFSKQDIITIYLNRVYLGAGNYGVDAAAHRYFGKSARDLTISESAIMAGLLKAPSRYSPSGNPEASFKRAEQVLANMVEAGYLTPAAQAQAKQALAQTIIKASTDRAESAHYFTDWIMDQLHDAFGDIREDLVVLTTFKPEFQKLGEQAIAEVMDKEGEKKHASQAALVAMKPDGAVLAMIGGRDYAKSQYNRAAQSRRQPGSSFKIFVYLAGLESGLTPSSMVEDKPVTVQGWSPKNYSGKYEGIMPLSDAVAQSLNTVAVQVAERAGFENVVAMARRLGITSDLVAEPSIALGSNEVTLLELTGAYAHLAADGAIVQPYGITEIDSATGEVLYKRTPPNPGQALSKGIVAMMNTLLEGPIQNPRGTGHAANIGRPQAGKTGTTSDYRDAWFMGYTPDLVAGVWVGNDDNTPMKKVTGGTLPAPIWRDFMKPALEGVPPRALPVAESYQPAPLPWENGQQAPPSAVLPPEEYEDRPADFHLDPAFWKKLFDHGGSEAGRVEHTYPEENRH